MPATVGGIIEQRDFGISISLDGNNINDVELNSSNELQLKADGTLLKDTGEWISKVIDIGDKFESYGKVFSTHIDNNGSVVAIQTRTSLNGNVWEDWKAVGLDGSILSTKQQFIQIKLVFHAGYDNQVVDLGSAFNSEYVDTTNGIKVNRDYVRTMIKDSGYTDEGSLHKITIDKSEFAKVDSVNVPQVASEINKSLILHGGEYKKPIKITNFNTPIMTSNTTPAPFVVSASEEFNSTTEAWYAFNKNYTTGGNGWVTGNILTSWLQLDVGSDNEFVVKKYRILNQRNTTISLTDRCPNTWTFEGSNDGVDWHILDTQTNISNWQDGVIKEFNLKNTKPFRYHRIKISKNNGNTTYTAIGQLELYGTLNPYDDWETVSSTLPTTDQFLSDGMGLSPLLDRKETELEPVILTSKSGILQGDEEGKTFSTIIDLNRLIDIKEIKVEVE